MTDMKPKIQFRRGFTTVIAILALAHAQMVFACASTGIAGAYSCCPSNVESHARHQMADGEDSAQCQCGQPATAVSGDGLLTAKGEKSTGTDLKTQWDLPFAAADVSQELTSFSWTKHLPSTSRVAMHPGTPTYLITRRLRI